MGGDDLSEDTLMAPVAMQRQPSADRLDRAEGVPLARRLPCPSKSVNRNTDNFLPKTRGGLMMGRLREWRTTGLGLKEKISDGYPKTVGPPNRARLISSGADRSDEKRASKIFR